LFLEYEAADLISFLEVGLVAGWDMHLIPTVGYARAFACHDEWVLFAANHAYQIEDTREQLNKLGIRIIDNRPAG